MDATLESLVDLLGHYFTYLALYPGTKLDHFKGHFKVEKDSSVAGSFQDSSVEYKDVFFDDRGKIDEASKLGVTCIHVDARVGKNFKEE